MIVVDILLLFTNFFRATYVLTLIALRTSFPIFIQIEFLNQSKSCYEDKNLKKLMLTKILNLEMLTVSGSQSVAIIDSW